MMNIQKNNILWLLIIITPFWLFFCLLCGSVSIDIFHLDATGKAILILRLNRIITGFMVGSTLACAGVVLQALLRNPLAEPYILGLSSGSGVGAALAIFSGLTAINILFLPASAFAGAVITLMLIFFIGRSAQSNSIYTLLLSGVIVGSVFSSVLMLIISLIPTEGLHSITWWMLGNLQVSSYGLLLISVIIMSLGMAGIWLISRELNILTLGTEMAHHLGLQPQLIIKIGLILATLITATAVALSGLIGFVGLIIPHMVRIVTGPDHRKLIPASIITGGLFLTLCDALGRTLFAPLEIPVGVITALTGGPFFLFLLVKRRKHGWIE
jgi:iron complex transport system permease protein